MLVLLNSGGMVLDIGCPASLKCLEIKLADGTVRAEATETGFALVTLIAPPARGKLS